mmetsp:Transcript_2093/g.3846  ORF Transcript_2093/g.3846 Transcript_2093/m.3846 type:complete len:529 (-) Transcript_2093:258-1844(-)
MLYHVSVHKLPIKHRLAHDTAQESVIYQVIFAAEFTCWIDRHTHLIGRTGHPQTGIRIKDFATDELKPFSCQSTSINTHFPNEFKSPQFSKILSTQRHDSIDRISQQELSPHVHTHMSLVPFDAQFGARILEPLCLVVEILDLRICQLRVRDQVPSIGCPDFRIHHAFRGGHQTENSGPNSWIFTGSKVQTSDVGTLFKVESFIEIDISLVVHTDPLEFEIGGSHGTRPSVFVVFEFDLDHFVVFGVFWFLRECQGQFESNALSGPGVGWARHQDSYSTRQQGKGCPRLDALGNFHFEQLRLFLVASTVFPSVTTASGGTTTSTVTAAVHAWSHGGIGGGTSCQIGRRWRRDDPNAHARPSAGRTSHHELLSLNRHGKLLSRCRPLGNGHHIRRWIGIGNPTDTGRIGRQQGIVAVLTVSGHVPSSSSCWIGRNRNLQGLSRSRIHGTSHSYDPTSGVDLKFFSRFDIVGDRNTKDRRPTRDRIGTDSIDFSAAAAFGWFFLFLFKHKHCSGCGSCNIFKRTVPRKND